MAEKTPKEVIIVLLVVPIVLTLFIYYGTQETLQGIAVRSGAETESEINYYSTLLHFLAVFILLFLIPALITKLLIRKPLAAYGLSFGDARFGIVFTAIVIPLLVLPLLYIGSRFGDVSQHYPLSYAAKETFRAFIIYEIAYALYYIGWEFFFRGFLIFGLKEHIGTFPAVLVSVIPSCIMHYAKPEIET
ncbi:MAG: hypothetical protein ABIH42_07070, partial [Planctomycetota bacterium]